MLLSANLADIKDLSTKRFGAKAGATQDFNAVASLLNKPSQHIWITFQDGCLWWCTVKDGITAPETGETASTGHFWLDCDRPWSNRSLGGKRLAMVDLPGKVTTVAGFKGTVCEPKAWEEILRILHDQRDPDVAAADQARIAYEAAVERIVSRLGWKDFEQLIDVILLRSGWSRISTLGKTREGIDLEVENLAANEIAFVQVKSASTQAILDDYIARFEQRRGIYARMIFAVHSPTGTLVHSAGLPVQVWTGSHIAELVVRLGLGNWAERMLALAVRRVGVTPPSSAALDPVDQQCAALNSVKLQRASTTQTTAEPAATPLGGFDQKPAPGATSIPI